MRHGPTRSMIARITGSDFLRWVTALRMDLYLYHKTGLKANKKRIYFAAASTTPAKPPPSTTHAGLIFHFHNTASAVTMMAHIGHPCRASPASVTVTPAISATAHT